MDDVIWSIQARDMRSYSYYSSNDVICMTLDVELLKLCADIGLVGADICYEMYSVIVHQMTS